MTKSPKICIIGSEGWGSALATAVCRNVLNDNFHPRVHLYVYDEIVRSNYLAEVINERHENVKYLPGIHLPDNLIAVNNLVDAAKEADILIFATPHDFVKSYCNILAGNVKSDAYAISLIRGFEHIGNGEIKLYSQTITNNLGIPCYSMMNAKCAMEMAQGKLCEITIGCNNKEHAKQLSSLIETENCMVSVIDDVYGVELCNTLKDLVALSAGFIDGLRLGDNARVACLHLGLKEMMRFIKSFNSTTKVSTCFESCGLANSVASAYVDKNATVAKNLVTTRKTIQEIESTLLNGRKLHGPLIAQDIYSYLEKQEMLEEYPLFSIVHQICQNEVPPEAIVDIIRNHPDLRNFTVTNLQKDEFLPVPSSRQNELSSAMESIEASRKPLVNEISIDELELDLDNGDFSAEGFWRSDWDHNNAQKNCMEQEMAPLKLSTGASNQEPEKGSVEFCFEMGSKHNNPDICLNIKDNILKTTIIEEDLGLMGSRSTNGKALNLMDPPLQPIGMSRSGADLIDRSMSANNTGTPTQFKDCDYFDTHGKRKWHAFENKSEKQSQPTMASSRNDNPNSRDSIGFQSHSPNIEEEDEGMCKMQLFEDNPKEDELVEIIRKKEREALMKNRSDTYSKLKSLLCKGAPAREQKENRNLHKRTINAENFNTPEAIAKAYKYDYKISINSRKIPIDKSPKNALSAHEIEAMKLKGIEPNACIESTNAYSFVESSPNFTNDKGSLERVLPTDFEQGTLDTTCRAKDYDSDFQTHQKQSMYNTMNASNRENLVQNGLSSMSPRITTDNLRQLGLVPNILKRHKFNETKITSEFQKDKEYVNRKKDNEMPSEILAKKKSARDALGDERPTNEATNERRSGDKFEWDDGCAISEKYRNSEYIPQAEVEQSLLDNRLPKHIESQEMESKKLAEDRKFGRFKIGEDANLTLFHSKKRYPEPEFKNKDTQKLPYQSYIRDEYNTEYNKLEDSKSSSDTISKGYDTRDNDSKKQEKQNEKPFPKQVQAPMKDAEAYPLDTATSEIENEPKETRIISDANTDTLGDYNKEDKKRQYKVSFLAEMENLANKSNARTSEWDWLLDNDKFDEACEDIKSKKEKSSYQKTDMSKYRHLLDFIAKKDKSKNKMNFDGKKEKPEMVPKTDMDDIRYSWPISTKSPVDPPVGSENLIKVTESEPTISKQAAERGNYNEHTEEMTASSKKDCRDEQVMSDSKPRKKPLLPVEKLEDRAEQPQSENEMETNKWFSKIMTKGRNKKTQSKEQLVDYGGANPYKSNQDMLMYLQDKLHDSDRKGKIMSKPFHPPLNPRVRIPRPPFDGREHEYHTINFRPFPNVQVKMPRKPSTPLSRSKRASSSVSKLRHPLKLPQPMMRSSFMALELGFFAALLSRYKGGWQ